MKEHKRRWYLGHNKAITVGFDGKFKNQIIVANK